MTATRPGYHIAFGLRMMFDASPCQVTRASIDYFIRLLSQIRLGTFDPASDLINVQRLYQMFGYSGLTTEMQALFDEAIAT
jgi:hypothetical protein